MALIDLNGNGGLGRYRILDGLHRRHRARPERVHGQLFVPARGPRRRRHHGAFFTQKVPTSHRGLSVNGLTYQTSFSHTDLTTIVQPVRMRASTQTEYIETPPGEPHPQFRGLPCCSTPPRAFPGWPAR